MAFETLLVSKRHVGSIAICAVAADRGLADILRVLTGKYDRVFGVAFPYSMGWHQRPTDGSDHESWHLHARFYPPLLRSATVRKFMVGFEMLAMPQRDITPEVANPGKAKRIDDMKSKWFRSGERATSFTRLCAVTTQTRPRWCLGIENWNMLPSPGMLSTQIRP